MSVSVALSDESARDDLVRWRLRLEAVGVAVPSAEDVGHVRESAALDAAMAAERGGAVGGLVSIPTRPKRQSASVARDSAERLREVLNAKPLPEAGRARVARLRRSIGFSARAISAALDRPGFRSRYVAMLTLTYGDGSAWRPDHVMRLLDHVRKWLKREHGAQLAYVWVAELQKRGALHYHVGLWLPRGVVIPKADQQGWWPHGSTNTVAARKAVPYLLKYMSKGLDTHGFPKGARINGSGGLDHAMRRARRWLGYPAFIKARADIHDDWRPAKGGGWCDPQGFVVPCEYERAWVGDAWCFRQVVDYGRPFEVSGPFSWINRGPSHG